jgi:glycosyltransferase involved in cell wall biosynthesis
MRIAYVYDAVYPEIPGGVQLRIWEVGKRLAEKGHDIHIFGMHSWSGPRTITREGVTLHGICPQMPMYHHGRRSVAEAILFACMVAAPLTSRSFDLIDCQHFPFFPVFSAKMSAVVRRTPLVITWHEVWGDYWYEYLGRMGGFGRVVERLVAGISSYDLAASALTAGALSALSGKVGEVIPNGIDRARILGLPPVSDRTDVIFAGRLIKEKHVDMLIEAIALCRIERPNIRCVIIGDGPEWERLHRLVRVLGVEDQITFTGSLTSHDDVISRMKAATIFAFPSTREGFGIVALEALACGLTLVTVDHPMNAAKDFITGKQGVLCDPTAPSLSAAIITAISRAPEMRPYNIAFTESYDWHRIADLYEAYYLKIIGGRLEGDQEASGKIRS